MGTFIFKGCENTEDITKDTEIRSISIGNMDMNKFDLPKISINGIELNETRETLYNTLGDSYEVSDNSNVSYYDFNSNRQFRFIFSAFEEDKFVTIIMVF